MNKSVTGFVMFAVGVAVGSIASWQYAKNEYEQKYQEDVESVKKAYRKREDKIKEQHKDDAEKEAYKEVYEDIAKSYGYKEEAQEVKSDMINKDKPYVIPPEEFGDIFEYQTISLTYYADKIITDEDDEIIEDIENTIGLDSLNHFGEYEDDSVFVRNDRLKCDYEILKDYRNYSDVIERYK